MALFWFCGKVRCPALRLHLGPRHAAALPLRPADALRLDFLFPLAMINLLLTGLLVALTTKY